MHRAHVHRNIVKPSAGLQPPSRLPTQNSGVLTNGVVDLTSSVDLKLKHLKHMQSMAAAGDSDAGSLSPASLGSPLSDGGVFSFTSPIVNASRPDSRAVNMAPLVSTPTRAPTAAAPSEETRPAVDLPRSALKHRRGAVIELYVACLCMFRCWGTWWQGCPCAPTGARQRIACWPRTRRV
jgi:hypothetical protein